MGRGLKGWSGLAAGAGFRGMLIAAPDRVGDAGRMFNTLIPFVGASVLVAMVPGPSTVVVLRESVVSGRRAGTAAVLGNETGVLLWGLAAALGLTALLAASELAYDVMRVAGAVVLIWFGVRGLWGAGRRGLVPGRAVEGHEGPEAGEPAGAAGGTAGAAGDGAGPGGGARGGFGRAFRLGLVTNVANPKAGVFAVSFLPQFVPEGLAGAAVPGALIVLSVLWVVIDMVWYLTLVWLVGRAGRVLGSARVRRRLERVSGVVLIGLGARLAVEAR